MARTMGEVLPCSFPDLFGCVNGPAGCPSACNDDGDDGSNNESTELGHRNSRSHRSRILFVDVGSGYGTLCHAAVAEYGCVASLGIEKYREPLVRSDALMASLDPKTRQKIKIVHADIGDCDLLSLFRKAPTHDVVLLFCNNLAMPPGARDRQAKQFSRAQELHAARVVVVSAVPLVAGFGDDAGSESVWAAAAGNGGGGDGDGSQDKNSGHAPHPLRASLGIGMTFNECHEVRMYEDARRAEKEREGASGGRGGEGEEEGEGDASWGEDDGDGGERRE